MRVAVFVAVMMAMGTSLRFCAAEAPPTTMISQVQIQRKMPDELQVMLFGQRVGMQFVLVVPEEDHFVIGVDEEASKLISATDDKGTDLSVQPKEAFPKNWISGFFCKIAQDHHRVAAPIYLPALPTPGATTVTFKANIVVRTGKDEKTQEIKPFDVTASTTVTCGKHTVKVAVDKNMTGGFSLTGADKKTPVVGVTFDENAVWVKSYEFTDEKGNTVKLKRSSSMGFNGQMTDYLDLENNEKVLGLRITYYQTVENITHPVDLKISLGLP